MSWIITVEDFVSSNYGEDSAPFRLYKTFNRKELDDYGQEHFDKQLSILIGVMQSCKNINPRSKTSENQLVRFIKSWPVVVALVSASFTFGWYFGATKFDKEKIEFYELTKKQAIEINELKGLADSKDSIISALENHNTKLQIDLTSAEEGRLLFYSESEKYKELLKKSSNNN